MIWVELAECEALLRIRCIRIRARCYPPFRSPIPFTSVIRGLRSMIPICTITRSMSPLGGDRGGSLVFGNDKELKTTKKWSANKP